MAKVRAVVPFVPVSRSDNWAKDAADQLTVLINENTERGWEYVGLENVTTIERGGCLGGGDKIVHAQVAIFEREGPE